jgi:Leucine-rich repeat (LRR) protein
MTTGTNIFEEKQCRFIIDPKLNETKGYTVLIKEDNINKRSQLIMKRSFQYKTLSDVSVLNKEQMCRTVSQRMEELVQFVPEEIWLLIFGLCESKKKFSLFKLCCISTQLNRIAEKMMRQVYRNIMTHSDRILRLFIGLTEFTLYDKSGCISGESVGLLTNLTSLTLYNEKSIINDKSIGLLTNLTELTVYNGNRVVLGDNCTVISLQHQRSITGESLSKLTKLKTLRLYDCAELRDADVLSLTQLTELKLCGFSHISDIFVDRVAGLTKLDLSKNSRITYSVIKLPNLKVLILDSNHSIEEKYLGRIKSLTALSLKSNSVIGKADWNPLACLPKLRELDLAHNEVIGDDHLVPLISFTHLVLERNNSITNDGVSRLTNLAMLNLNNNTRITGDGLVTLSYLTQLHLLDNGVIKRKDLLHMKHLKKLVLSSGSNSCLLEIKASTPECEIVL